MNARGLTLAEVLVALALGLLATSVALAWLARARLVWRAGESLASLQEALDSATRLLADDLRLAGFLGLAPAGTVVAGASPAGMPEAAGLAVAGGCAPSLALDLAQPVDGADGAWRINGTVAAGCAPGPAGRFQPGADTLVIRHAQPSASVPVSGRLAIESTLAGARVAADGQRRLGAGSRWHELEASLYYVSPDSSAARGQPSLRRKRLVGGSRPAMQDEELVAGIADLQVEFGLDRDDDGDTAVDRWVPAGSDRSGATVRAVRLWLLAQGEVIEGPAIAQPALSYANRAWPAETARHRRRVGSLVVQLRNGAEP